MVNQTKRPSWRKRAAFAAIVSIALAALTIGRAFAGLAAGSLPTAGFTYLSVTDNVVNMTDVGTGDGIHLKTKGLVSVKTTFSRLAPSSNLLGWHYHNGPVIVTVTSGTLTLYDETCAAIDIEPGHSYIESTGQVFAGRADPTKNGGVATVEWFTTRLFPAGSGDPVEVPAPCSP